LDFSSLFGQYFFRNFKEKFYRLVNTIMENKKMKAVICKEYGPPEVLQITEINKPVPKANELLIKIKASAVNSGDVRVRALDVPGYLRIVMRVVLGITKPRKPVLGIVFSGVVENIGEKVKNFKVGDEVYASAGFKFGAYAAYITLPEDGVITLKPSKASFLEAAAIPFGGMSAIYFLRKANISGQENQKVLIYGATGAVGTAAIQIAKYYKAEVTAVCSEEGLELAKRLGSDHVLVYTKQDFTKSSEKYDIIFDAVGKTNKKAIRSILKKEGIFITVGGLDVASETKEQLEFLKQLVDENLFEAIIDKVYPFEHIVEAHRYVDLGRKKGNVVIEMED